MDDDLEEVATNRRMLQNVIDAHNQISPKLQFVAFVGGTRVWNSDILKRNPPSSN